MTRSSCLHLNLTFRRLFCYSCCIELRRLAIMALHTRMQRSKTITNNSQCTTHCTKLMVPRPTVRTQQVQQAPQQQLLQQVASAAATAALAVSLALLPVAPAQAASSMQLADLLREQFGFVDSNKDGIITKTELQQLAKSISTENNVPLVDQEQLDFTLKLFDLNQDGKLTTEELLRSLVLDGAVSDDAVDADVFAVFDRNNNNTIEKEEFRETLGDVGSNGDAAKDFVYNRVDNLSGSEGHLKTSAFGNAFLLMRAVLLGY